MWRFFRNCRLILRFHRPTIFSALIYWAHRAVVLAIAWFICWFLQQIGPIFTYHRKSDYSRFHIDHLTRQAFINGELLVSGIRLSTVVVPQTKTTCTNDEHLVMCTADFYAILQHITAKNAKRHIGLLFILILIIGPTYFFREILRLPDQTRFIGKIHSSPTQGTKVTWVRCLAGSDANAFTCTLCLRKNAPTLKRYSSKS